MARTSTPLIFLILSIVLVIQVSAQVDVADNLKAASPKAASPKAASPRIVLGGWKDIKDPKDPKVVDAAKFAIDANNKKANGLKLTFGSVVKGQYQIVSGINYKLTIAATSTDSPATLRNYEAVVYDKPWAKVRQLISFKAL